MTPARRLCLARKAKLAQIEAFRARTRERPAYEIWCLDPERAEEIRAMGFAVSVVVPALEVISCA